MQSKTALMALVAFFATVCTTLVGYAVGFELCSDRPDLSNPGLVVVASMAIAAWGFFYSLWERPAPAVEEEVDPELAAYHKAKEAEHASFLVWQSEKDAAEKAALEAYQQRNKYSC